MGLAILSLALLPLMILWNGLMTALAGWQLYQWFLIPLNAPDISGWHIAGIGVFIGLLRYRIDPHKKDERDGTPDERLIASLILGFATPLMMAIWSLAMGFLFAKFAGLI